MVISGFRALGNCRPQRGYFGCRDIGPGATTSICGAPAIGDRASASTAALITASGTLVLGTREGAGRTAYFLQSDREQFWRCYDHERIRETRRRRCARAEGRLQRRDTARPTLQEEATVREQRVAILPAQLQHERVASANKALLASEDHGRPAIAATAKPGEFSGRGVVAAREPGMTPATRPATTPRLPPNRKAVQGKDGPVSNGRRRRAAPWHRANRVKPKRIVPPRPESRNRHRPL
jgi:hypothetical protein